MGLRVAVVGSGPAGSSAAEVLAKAGIETYLFERKLDNAKPCGGAIPLCMVDEFDLPQKIIDRQVKKMKMISPSNREVNIGSTLKNGEYIGMCRREVLDGFLRNRAAELGANLINGTVYQLDIPDNDRDPYTLHYADHSTGAIKGEMKTLKVDLVIGADGPAGPEPTTATLNPKVFLLYVYKSIFLVAEDKSDSFRSFTLFILKWILSCRLGLFLGDRFI